MSDVSSLDAAALSKRPIQRFVASIKAKKRSNSSNNVGNSGRNNDDTDEDVESDRGLSPVHDPFDIAAQRITAKRASSWRLQPSKNSSSHSLSKPRLSVSLDTFVENPPVKETAEDSPVRATDCCLDFLNNDQSLHTPELNRKSSKNSMNRIRFASIIVTGEQELAFTWLDTISTRHKLEKEFSLERGDYFLHFKNDSIHPKATIRLRIETRDVNGENVSIFPDTKTRVPSGSTYTINYKLKERITFNLRLRMKGKIMKKGNFELNIYKRSRGYSLSPSALGVNTQEFKQLSSDINQYSSSTHNDDTHNYNNNNGSDDGNSSKNINTNTNSESNGKSSNQRTPNRICFSSFDVIDTEAVENVEMEELKKHHHEQKQLMLAQRRDSNATLESTIDKSIEPTISIPPPEITVTPTEQEVLAVPEDPPCDSSSSSSSSSPSSSHIALSTSDSDSEEFFDCD